MTISDSTKKEIQERVARAISAAGVQAINDYASGDESTNKVRAIVASTASYSGIYAALRCSSDMPPKECGVMANIIMAELADLIEEVIA